MFMIWLKAREMAVSLHVIRGMPVEGYRENAGCYCLRELVIRPPLASGIDRNAGEAQLPLQLWRVR